MTLTVDTSALIAILFAESEAKQFVEVISTSRYSIMSAPSLLECNLVAVRNFGDSATSLVQQAVIGLKIEIVPFKAEAVAFATDAFLRYGKGRGHPAQLNFGDCISYAVSKVEAMPLLFKGDDFRLTDVECALPAAG